MKDDRPPPEVTEYFRKIGKKYGALGGKQAAENLTPAQRKRRAKKASAAAAEAMTPEQRKERARNAALAMHAKKRAATKRKPGA